MGTIFSLFEDYSYFLFLHFIGAAFCRVLASVCEAKLGLCVQHKLMAAKTFFDFEFLAVIASNSTKTQSKTVS